MTIAAPAVCWERPALLLCPAGGAWSYALWHGGLIAAEGEFLASQKLADTADIMAKHPIALQLRNLQTMAEISVEKNSTIIFPAQFMTTVKEAISLLKADSSAK